MEHELREALRGAMAATATPAPMSSAAVLDAARRTRFRHHAGWAAGGSALAVVALTVSAALVSGPSNQTSQFGAPGSPSGTTGPTAGPTASVGASAVPQTLPSPQPAKSTGPWPTGPDGKPQEDRTARAGSRYDQGVRLLNALVSVVPAGYTALPERNHQAQFNDRENGIELWEYTASAPVSRDGGTGMLTATVNTAGDPRLNGEPCELAQHFWGLQGPCETVSVGAARVGVVTNGTDPEQYDQWAAYRHPDGVVVFVAEAKQSTLRSLPTGRGDLKTLPFSAAELAALAIDERFHLQ